MRRKPLVSLPRIEFRRDELPFEPQNEAGVAMVFAMVADKLGFKIRGAQYAFPDCEAVLKGKRLQVELEFRSRSFVTHVWNGQYRGPRDCNLVVCWRHDWPGLPGDLSVLELRKLFGIGWSVWLQPMHSEFAGGLPRGRTISALWSVPSRAGPDDLILIYRPGSDPEVSGEKRVEEIMRVRSQVERVTAGWKQGLDWMASLQHVATLEKPVTLSDLIGLGVKPQSLQGRPEVSALWKALRTRLLRRQPELRTALARYGPDRLR